MIKPQNRDFIRVGKSRIEGTGVFAKRKIPKGSRILEYTGKHISREKFFIELVEGKATHTYVFGLNETTMIDAARNGNDARFINHSCEPNCETYIFDEKVYIYAMRDIIRGEELSFDYHLAYPFGIPDKSLKDAYLCVCGSALCRGTMLASIPRKNNRRK